MRVRTHILLGLLCLPAALFAVRGLGSATQVAVAAPNYDMPTQPYLARKTLGEILFENAGKLPAKFTDLLKAVGGTEDDMILIPRGRSLVKDHTDYANPRILLLPQVKSAERPPKLILTYTPRLDSMEIMAWNPSRKAYDFLEVSNYSNSAKQTIYRPDEAKCTSCHFQGRVHFTPQPWAEVTDFSPFDFDHPRVRRTPKKIAEALKHSPGYPMYYGINLEKYKKAATRRVLDFFDNISFTEPFRRELSICSQLCQSGDSELNLECRKVMLQASIDAALERASGKVNVLQGSPESLELESRHKRVFEEESARLAGKPARASNELLPERDPETGNLYMLARSEAETKRAEAEEQAYRKKHHGRKRDAIMSGKFTLTEEEKQNFRLGEGLPKDTPMSTGEGYSALGKGCLQFNPSEFAALKTLSEEGFSAEKSDPRVDSFLSKGPFTADAAMQALASSHEPPLKFQTDAEYTHQDVLNSVVKDEPALLAHHLMAKGSAPFQTYCSRCHTGQDGDPPPLPVDDILGGKRDHGTDYYRTEMIARLSNCRMPPPRELTMPSDALRREMVAALGGDAAQVRTCAVPEIAAPADVAPADGATSATPAGP